MRIIFQNLFTFSIDTGITLQQAVGAVQDNMAGLFRSTLSIEAQQELSLLCNITDNINLQQGHEDEIRWNGNATGNFTVRSAYRLIKGGPRIKQISKIWKVDGPPRMRIFVWLANRNSILTHDNLQKRGWEIVSRCTLCRATLETGHHLFQECAYTLQLYEKLKSSRSAMQWPPIPTIEITNKEKTGILKQEQKTILLIMNFIIWREQCARCFTYTEKDTEELMHEVNWQFEFYKKKEHHALRETNTTGSHTGTIQETVME